jgi:hypothetical protein
MIMKTAIKMMITAGFALTAGLAAAQGDDPLNGGRVINGPWFDAAHKLLFSQHDNTMGTARSAAMGGAFTSLGADLSTMNINPAGLGMYKSSDWGLTAALSIDGMRTTAPNISLQNIRSGGSRTTIGINNFGAAFNVYEGSGTLTSITLGASYNRAANFNSHTWVDTFNEDSTIGDMFARQLNYMIWDKLPAEDLDQANDPFRNGDIRLHEWGAVMGLHTGLAGLNEEGEYGYRLDAIPSNHRFSSTTRGGIYEYNFAAGVNISNVIYLGATLGVTDIVFAEDLHYGEDYSPGSELGYLTWNQNTDITGSGFTGKLGVIARPVEAIRLGLSLHLPTWYNLDKTYRGSMNTGSGGVGNGFRDNLSLNSAPKVLAGVSGVIAGKAIVAADWEVAWYNRIKMARESASESEARYKPANTFRAGLEYLLNDRVSLRAGGVWMMDFMRNSFALENNPSVRGGYNVTGGVGFSIGSNGYVDVAYVYNRARMTSYDLWLYDDDGQSSGDFAGEFDTVGGDLISRSYTPVRQRHMISVTLGNRF